MNVLTDENEHDTSSGALDVYTQCLVGDFLNLDRRKPNEGTSCSSSEDSTAMRGFLVRPTKYASCQVCSRQGDMRHQPREGDDLS